MNNQLTVHRVAFESLGDEWHDLVREGYHDDYPGMGEMYGGVVTAEEKISQMLRWGQGIDAWVVRDDDGRLIGLLTADVDDGRLTVYDFFVARGQRRRGIGRALLGAALVGPGLREVAAEVNVANVASRTLFESLGFTPARTVSWYVLRPDEASQ